MGRIWLASLAVVLVSCEERVGERSILPDDFTLRAGDVVFRRGEGITSRVVLATDANGNYSHVGIVVDSAGSKMIVHAVPGEPDFDGDADRVKMDTPGRFFSRKRATKGEVCRPRNDSIAQRAAEAALRVYRKGVLFTVKACCLTTRSTIMTQRRCIARNSSFMPIDLRESIWLKAGVTR